MSTCLLIRWWTFKLNRVLDLICPWLQIDLVKGMMDCLYADCTPCITDCVMAELEKLGQKYRVALKIAGSDTLVKTGLFYVNERVWALCWEA